MASATQVVIRAEDTGLWRGKQDGETAKKVSELLQEDLEKHHVFFNPSGFHNHLVHQLLTLYSTGASPSTLQSAYDANKTYQVAHTTPRPDVVAALQDDWPAHAPTYLGHGKHYSDFLAFFQHQIDQRGWEAVLREFLFAETPRARDLTQRLFAGVVHPMIALSFGLEWEQPALVAEGLAQTAVHRNVMGEFYDKVDEAVRQQRQQQQTDASTPVEQIALADLYERLGRDHATLVGSAHWQDENKLYDGVLGRGLDDAVALCARIRVSEEDVEERTAEILHHNAYVAASAAWKPPYIPKYDFFLIHSLNSSPFLLSLDKPFIPKSARVRIMEHKMRYDLVQYIARGAPALSAAHVQNYPLGGDVGAGAGAPEELIPRYHKIVDDGHLIKVVRALLLAQRVSRRWEGKPWVRLREGDWIKAHWMLLRGVEGQETFWLRGAGFEEAWEGVDKLDAARL